MAKDCLKAKRLKAKVVEDLKLLQNLADEVYGHSAQHVTWSTDARPWMRGKDRKGAFRDSPSVPTGSKRPSQDKVAKARAQMTALRARIQQNATRADSLWVRGGCQGSLLDGARRQRRR